MVGFQRSARSLSRTAGIAASRVRDGATHDKDPKACARSFMKIQPKCFILTPMLDVASTIAHLVEQEKTSRTRKDGEQKKSIEIQLRFNTGAKIDAAFPN